MSLAFSFPQKLVPVVADSLSAARRYFPVRRIYCVGQNYESHAKEMHGSTNRANPFFFTKPADSLVVDQDNFSSATSQVSMAYPPMTSLYHHEVELVVALGPASDGGVHPLANLTAEDAAKAIFGYGVGLDMTRRDLQLEAKREGKPWDLAKGADDGAAVSPLITAANLLAQHPNVFKNARAAEFDVQVPVVSRGTLELSISGKVRQRGDVRDMVTAIPQLIARLSQYVALQAGDLIYTGTPSGVGPVERGDVVVASIEGIGTLTATLI